MAERREKRKEEFFSKAQLIFSSESQDPVCILEGFLPCFVTGAAGPDCKRVQDDPELLTSGVWMGEWAVS